MTKIRLAAKAPRCPLCHDWMLLRWVPDRKFLVYACDTDRIAISTQDPFVGRWEEAIHRSGGIKCPRPSCERPMRYFATSTGFMKAVCPKCKASISNTEPDRDKEVVHTPEAPGTLQ